MAELSERRSQTASRIEELRSSLTTAEKLATGKACVYMTGSFGRCEAGKFSDLDLFILGKNNNKKGRDGKEGSLLSRLDEICIKADLIEVNRKLGIQEFSGDGRWLTHYSVDELTKTLGYPEDDVENTFTARLLLLLESRALLGTIVYEEAVGDVLVAYWRDYEDHKTDFIPAFLTNDILRLWRTFCVNYEARTERVPEDEKAKGKIKNYKLKHSRLLTCYSAILFLLAVYNQNGTVAPSDAIEMIKKSPTERLEWLRAQSFLAAAHRSMDDLMQQYEVFLKATNVSEDDLKTAFMDKKLSEDYIGAAYAFGDKMFETLTCIGNGSRFHRLLVI